MTGEWERKDILEEKVNELVDIALDKLVPETLDPHFKEDKVSIIDRFLSEYAALYGNDFAEQVAGETSKKLSFTLKPSDWEEIRVVLTSYINRKTTQ